LKKRYSPSTAPALAILQKKFFASKLKKGGDPDLFLSYVEDLRYRMGEMKYVMEDDQFFLHILNYLTPEYDQQVFSMESKIGTQDADQKLKIEDVRDVLCLRNERINKGRNDDEDGKEIALSAGGKFKGKCIKCGKIGHKSVDCRSSGNNNNNNKKKYKQ
jgi:gag-polypeptide of LTR copia-type